eukprot:5249434-Lingulodinium_polyedra.AAC.1
MDGFIMFSSLLMTFMDVLHHQQNCNSKHACACWQPASSPEKAFNVALIACVVHVLLPGHLHRL